MFSCIHRVALVCAVVLPVTLWAQERVTAESITQLPIGTDAELLAFTSAPNGSDVALVAPKSGSAVRWTGAVNARLQVWQNGVLGQELSLPGLLQAPLVFSPSHLFFTRDSGKSLASFIPVTHVIEIASGRILTLADDFRPFNAVFAADGLAVIGSSSAGTLELRTFVGPEF